MPVAKNQAVSDEWVSFPGGELEGRRPKALCSSCREERRRTTAAVEACPPRTLCFQCYRAELDRDRALKAAGELDTASEERFQTMLPLEPVNAMRLEMLKAERSVARAAMRQGTGQFVDKRRQAQIAARHALQAVFAGVDVRRAANPPATRGEDAARSAIHAAELQLPEAWLPFVVSR